MFRSLANLLAHKRSYCKISCKQAIHQFSDNFDKETGDETVVPRRISVQPEPVETVFPEEPFELENYSPSIELLKDAGILNEIEERPLVDTLKPVQHSQSKLSGIVKALIAKRNAQESEEKTHQNVLLEPLSRSSKAVFQV